MLRDEWFRNELLNCVNIYDIMAISYKAIEPYHNYRGANCDFTKFKYINDAFGEYFEVNGQNEFADISMVKTKIGDAFDNGYYDFNNDEVYYNIIQQIDSIACFEYPKVAPRFQLYTTVLSLNENTMSTKVYILPRMESSIISILENESKNQDKGKKGLRTRQSKQSYESINSKLTNFLICSNNDFSTEITILADNDEFCNRIKKRQSLKVGFVPFYNDDILSLFELDFSTRDTFSITAPKPDKRELILEIFKAQLSEFRLKDVDIIIFPEMYLTEDIVNDMQNIIKDSFKNSDEEQLKLIITGTLLKDNSNICYMYDSLGHKLFTQNKYESYSFEGKVEHLNPTEYKIHMLDINGIGRIFTFICKDISNKSLYNIFSEARGDILCFPAYSPSLDVKRNAETYTTDTNCILFFSNACAPRRGKNIGFCAIPQRKGTLSDAYFKYYKCKNPNCAGKCKPQVLTMHYTEFYQTKKILRCKLSIN